MINKKLKGKIRDFTLAVLLCLIFNVAAFYLIYILTPSDITLLVYLLIACVANSKIVNYILGD